MRSMREHSLRPADCGENTGKWELSIDPLGRKFQIEVNSLRIFRLYTLPPQRTWKERTKSSKKVRDDAQTGCHGRWPAMLVTLSYGFPKKS